MSDRDEPTLDALATKISELHSYNGNEQAAAADEAFDAVADLLAKKSKALGKAERERDEARADHRRSMHAAIEQRERLAQATALLREWRDAYEHEDNVTWLARCCEVRDRADAFLAGQPAPGAKPVVDDAMVERALSKWAEREVIQPSVATLRCAMRAALAAALEWRT